MVKGFLHMQSLNIEKFRLVTMQYMQQLVIVSAAIFYVQEILAHYPTMTSKKQSFQYLKVENI